MSLGEASSWPMCVGDVPVQLLDDPNKRTSCRKATSDRRHCSAPSTRSGVSWRNLGPSSITRPLTAVADRSSMYRCRFAGSVGNAMPVVRMSSPPCSSAAMPGSSLTWTHRTGLPSCSAPARTSGCRLERPGNWRTSSSWPRRTGLSLPSQPAAPATSAATVCKLSEHLPYGVSLAGAARWSRLRKPLVTLREDERAAPTVHFWWVSRGARRVPGCVGSLHGERRDDRSDNRHRRRFRRVNWGGLGRLPDDVCHGRHLGRLGLGQRPHPDHLGNAPQWLQVAGLRKEMSTCSFRAHPPQARHVRPHRCHRKGLAPHDLPR